jgi:hypothetical protein
MIRKTKGAIFQLLRMPNQFILMSFNYYKNKRGICMLVRQYREDITTVVIAEWFVIGMKIQRE